MGKLYEIVKNIHRRPVIKKVEDNLELNDIFQRLDEVIKIAKRQKRKSAEFRICKSEQILHAPYPYSLFGRYANIMEQVVIPIKTYYEKKGFVVESCYTCSQSGFDEEKENEIIFKISWR